MPLQCNGHSSYTYGPNVFRTDQTTVVLVDNLEKSGQLESTTEIARNMQMYSLEMTV